MTLAVSSKTLPLTQVQGLADTRLTQKISQVAGVGLVSVSGGNQAGRAHSGEHVDAGIVRA